MQQQTIVDFSCFLTTLLLFWQAKRTRKITTMGKTLQLFYPGNHSISSSGQSAGSFGGAVPCLRTAITLSGSASFSCLALKERNSPNNLVNYFNFALSQVSLFLLN